MTVVVALAREGRVVMAADTCTNYAGTHVLGARKIIRARVGEDEALIAAAGTGALLKLPAQLEVKDTPDPDDQAAVETWAFAVATGLSELAAASTPSLLVDNGEGRQIFGGAFLMAWRGRLIYLFTHQAVVLPDGVAALGVGADYAFGALEQSVVHRSPEDAVVSAVLGACARYDGCRVGPEGPQVEHLGVA